MGTQELQVIEFEVTKLVPAEVVSNIDDLKNFMEIVKQKYEGWIITEDDIDVAKSERTKLNKLEKKISDERKKIQKKANADIETLIENLKTYEKEVKGISNFIGDQLKGYDEKIREEKKVEVQKKINNIFTRNPGLKIFLEWNDKWLDKSFTFKKIENEVQKQYDELAELEAKKERGKEEAIKVAQQQNDEVKKTQKTAVNGKYYDITLRFPKAPSQFLKDFKKLVDSYGLEYIKIESKQI